MRRNAGALCVLALLLTAASPGETERWYVVREGDTLTRIATRHDVTVEAIASSNRLNPGGILRIGQRLRIPSSARVAPPASAPTTQPLPQNLSRPNRAPAPPATPSRPAELAPRTAAGPEFHIVEQGETLYGLSRRYGVPLADLMSWNGLGPKDLLRVAQRLRVRPPGSPAQAGASPATAPAAALVAEPVKPPEGPPPEPKPPAPVEPKPSAEVKARGGAQAPAGAKPDAAPMPPPEPAERVVEETPEAEPAPRGRVPVISTKRPPSRFRLPFFGRPKTSGSFVHLQGVRDSIDKPRIKSGRWKYIVVHHSGTSKGSGEVFEHYHRVVRGMENGLAYHFVIGNGSYTGDGEIEVGDRWLKQKAGGHLYSEFLNEISIGICFVGNFNEEKPTARQIAACIELVDYLRQICPGSRPKFVLHREINPRPTECPGRLFPGDALRKRLK